MHKCTNTICLIFWRNLINQMSLPIITFLSSMHHLSHLRAPKVSQCLFQKSCVMIQILTSELLFFNQYHSIEKSINVCHIEEITCITMYLPNYSIVLWRWWYCLWKRSFHLWFIIFFRITVFSMIGFCCLSLYYNHYMLTQLRIINIRKQIISIPSGTCIC